jgi:hypothetical protein
VATLAAALLTETALALPSVGGVEIHHDQANVASGGVPARLGYTRVATEADIPEAPGEVGVDCRWAMRREEFPSSPASRLLAEARSAARLEGSQRRQGEALGRVEDGIRDSLALLRGGQPGDGTDQR